MLQAQHHALHQLATHLVTDLRCFLVGTNQVIAVMHVDLLHFEFVGQQTEVVYAPDLVVQRSGQLVLYRTGGAGIAGCALGFLFVGQDQFVRCPMCTFTPLDIRT